MQQTSFLVSADGYGQLETFQYIMPEICSLEKFWAGLIKK